MKLPCHKSSCESSRLEHRRARNEGCRFPLVRFHFRPLLHLLLAAIPALSGNLVGQPAGKTFSWPDGKLAGLSLSFDDARQSQVDVGLEILDRHGVKATFFVVPSSMEARLEAWQKAAAGGHEIGNHSLTHPCSGNFSWSRHKALEDYSLETMRDELMQANRRILELVGTRAETFAYPCGQTFVRRGVSTQSYVPLVARLFTAGRGWLGESGADPAFCDLAQIPGVEMDGKDFEEILERVEAAKKEGQWLVLAGHEIGSPANQTTRVQMLEKLLAYAVAPHNKLWLAPVGTIARYIRDQRAQAAIPSHKEGRESPQPRVTETGAPRAHGDPAAVPDRLGQTRLRTFLLHP